MRSQLILSSAAFSDWFDTLPGRVTLERLLQGYFNRVTGFEVSLRLVDAQRSLVAAKEHQQRNPLLGLSSALTSGVRASIHALPERHLRIDFGAQPHRLAEDAVIATVVDAAQICRATTVTLSGLVSIDELRSLRRALNPDITLSLMNSSERGDPFSDLRNIEDVLGVVPGLSAAFNLRNWFALDRSSASIELQEFHLRCSPRLSHLHFATPLIGSRPYKLYSDIENGLYTCSREERLAGWFVEEFSHIPWVIEGFVPRAHPGLLADEIFACEQLTSTYRQTA